MAIAGLGRRGLRNKGNKQVTVTRSAKDWGEKDWDWETFVLWGGHCGDICWQCAIEQHSNCHQPECQCKNEVCTEIRENWQKRRAMVAALVVGQDVCLDAGVYGLDGKVVEVAEWGVYVKTYGSISRRIPSHLLRFDKEGKLLEDVPWYLSPLATEGGPWYISPLPDGQQAIWEQMHEQTMREHQSFIAWWKSAT
jgi:hypothetical protein